MQFCISLYSRLAIAALDVTGRPLATKEPWVLTAEQVDAYARAESRISMRKALA